ncbi:scavenger receptor cysteine-rich type 1 protein M130 isoform X2 [Esox lucius]|nr:scavenger receptor cysteine-rich type 1 protein M130 isoform X2 [Esox lucius]
MTVSFGRVNQSAVFTSTLKDSTKVKFTTTAIAANEGIYVCWYNDSRTGEVSAASNPVNLIISPLPSPWLSVPAFIPIGGNYTVRCSTTSSIPNRTLSLYFRKVPVTVGNETFMFWGSAALTGNQDVIILDRKLVDATESFEFICRLDIVDANQHLYLSPLSNYLPAIAEEAPIRLVPENQGSKCLGQLEVQIGGRWGPVCQEGNVDFRARQMARVVCRELSCGTPWSVETTRDDGSAEFSLGSISCQGNEGRLRDCVISEVHPSCSRRTGLDVVCSDALPAPQILITGYRVGSRIAISDEHSLEFSCMFDAPWFGTREIYMYLRRNSESNTETIYSKQLASGEKLTTTLDAPIKSGEYTCTIGESKHVASVKIFVSKWPSVGLIVAGVFAGLIGVGILVSMYICAK